MIKIAHLIEINKVKQLPREVAEVISSTVAILDKEYGEYRDSSLYGGYVLLIESIENFQKIKEDIYLDLEKDAIPEFVDKITCSNGEVYTNSLIIFNSDFNIIIIAPLELTPDNFKKHIVE